MDDLILFLSTLTVTLWYAFDAVVLHDFFTPGYEIAENHVAYVTWPIGMQKQIDVLGNADPETFEQLSPHFGLDNQHVYHDTRILLGADPATFSVIDNSYSRDGQHVYYHARSGVDYSLPGAEPHSFRSYDDGLARDDRFCFDHGDEIPCQGASLPWNSTRSRHS